MGKGELGAAVYMMEREEASCWSYAAAAGGLAEAGPGTGAGGSCARFSTRGADAAHTPAPSKPPPPKQRQKQKVAGSRQLGWIWGGQQSLQQYCRNHWRLPLLMGVVLVTHWGLASYTLGVVSESAALHRVQAMAAGFANLGRATLAGAAGCLSAGARWLPLLGWCHALASRAVPFLVHWLLEPAAAVEDASQPESGRLFCEAHGYPKVLVQLPMYNEREVYERAIAKACALEWPREHLLIQVLDDSTMDDVAEGMQREVRGWRAAGVDVRYRRRLDRQGFKAGNLREGLQEPYARAFEYVAVLDADFEPASDWLLRTIPHLQADSGLALVQTRWVFSNAGDCMLTRFQEVELRWHFLAEQLASSHLCGFFGFNGTAGVWRLAAIAGAGNWRDDTTVEDMDMAVCAALVGWKFILLPHVECLSEVPATFATYRKQQHRWTCGPTNLLRKRSLSILSSKAASLFCKAYMVGVYIGLRRGLRHIVTFCFWLVLPLWLVAPSMLPHPPLVTAATMLLYPACLFAFSPRLLWLLPSYVVFMGAMSVMRIQAFAAGLLDLSSSRTWDVTQKLGKRSASLPNLGEDAGGPLLGREKGPLFRPMSLPLIATQNSPRSSASCLLQCLEGEASVSPPCTPNGGLVSNLTRIGGASCASAIEARMQGQRAKRKLLKYELAAGVFLLLSATLAAGVGCSVGSFTATSVLCTVWMGLQGLMLLLMGYDQIGLRG
eukprot:jgi/Mesen1/10843/ME000093S10352